MKYNIAKCFVLVMLSLSVFSCTENTDSDYIAPAPPDPGSQLSYLEKSTMVYELIQSNYKVSSSDFYLENFPKKAGDLQASYLWSLDGMLSASTQLLALGYEGESLNDPFNALELYFDNNRQPAAYASIPIQLGQGDRFYDDNAIVAIDLIERYQVTNEAALLERAEALVPFSLSGESDEQGGGLFWNEQLKADPNNPNCNKATSSTAFTLIYLLKLYEITNKKPYLDFAMRLYDWLNSRIQDPVDKLFWNDINLNGVVNKTKWTYNSGAMITSNVLLFEINNDNTYLQRARDIAASTYTYFSRSSNGITFLPNHDPWFNTCLFRGYLDLAKHDKSAENYVNLFINNADYAWSNARNSYDLFYEDWSGMEIGRDYWLLNQACVAETYARIGLFNKEK